MFSILEEFELVVGGALDGRLLPSALYRCCSVLLQAVARRRLAAPRSENADQCKHRRDSKPPMVHDEEEYHGEVSVQSTFPSPRLYTSAVRPVGELVELALLHVPSA